MSDYDEDYDLEDGLDDFNFVMNAAEGNTNMTKKTIDNDEPHFVLAGRGYLITGKRFATQAEALEEAPKHVKPGYGASEIVVYEAKAVVKADPVPVKTTILMTQSA